MKSLLLFLIVISSVLLTAFAEEGRIPVIKTFLGNRPATLPDEKTDPTYLWPVVLAEERVLLDDFQAEIEKRVTKTAVSNGDWSSTNTWGGSVPSAGAVVKIPTGITVRYDVESDAALKDVFVEGTLSWARNVHTKMVVDTIFSTGRLDIGTAADPIPESGTPGKPRAHIIFDGANPGTSMRLGMVSNGTVRIHGARKPEKLRAAADPLAGQTTIQLQDDVSKWQVGDKIIVVAMSDAGSAETDPQYTGPRSYYRENGNAPENSPNGHTIGDWAFIGYKKSHDEVRTITKIEGKVITIDTPLAFDHRSKSATLPRGEKVTIPTIVASLSRSVRMESANPTGSRGHSMFMHNDDVDARWAEALNMGRTRQDPSLNATNNYMLDKQGGVSIMDPDNVRGRYPWHIHWTGPYVARNLVVFEGLSSWAPTAEVPLPGWGITQHGSRTAIEKCVVYNVRGAGIVSELGNEIGQWLDNVVCWCRGDGFHYGWGKRGEIVINHHGSAGIAYENQARQILQQHNWATSSHIGWSFHQQSNLFNYRIPEHRSLRLVDPWVGGGKPGIGDMNEGYGVEQAQIPEWSDNTCVGVGDGFFVAHRQFTNRFDQLPMISKGYHCIGVARPVHIENYSFWYSFYNFVWIDGLGGSAIRYGDKSAAFNHANGYIRGYSRVASIKGYNIDGWFAYIDHDCTNPKPFDVESLVISATNYATPTTHKLYVHSLRMGGWEKLGDNTIRPRPTPYKNDSQIRNGPATWNITSVKNSALRVDANREYPVGFQATIEDGFGTRPYPLWSWFDASADEGIFDIQQSTEVPTRIVQRNGCFFDTSDNKWKSRMYFVDHNRLNGDYIIIPFDITLVNFPNSTLEANIVVPTPPVFPLLPESIASSDAPNTSPSTESTATDDEDGENAATPLAPAIMIVFIALVYYLSYF